MQNRIIHEYLQMKLDELFEIDLKTPYEVFLIDFLADECCKYKSLDKGL